MKFQIIDQTSLNNHGQKGFLVELSREEALLLRDIVTDAFRRTLITTETISVKTRIQNLSEGFKRAMREMNASLEGNDTK